MALKGDRLVLGEEITFSMDEVATRGGVACLSTVGSGSALDSSVAIVSYVADPSAKTAVGILGGDMVNIDLTRQKINKHKNEVQKGGKVNLITNGWVLTNKIANGVTPAAQQSAYAATAGLITNTAAGGGPKIGHFLSTKDEDGYCKVWVNLPSNSQY